MFRNVCLIAFAAAFLFLGSQASAQPRAWFGDSRAIAFQDNSTIMSFGMLMGQVGPSFLDANQHVTPVRPVATRFDNGRVVSLPGARGPGSRPLPGIPEPAAALVFGAGALLVARRMRATRP